MSVCTPMLPSFCFLSSFFSSSSPFVQNFFLVMFLCITVLREIYFHLFSWLFLVFQHICHMQQCFNFLKIIIILKNFSNDVCVTYGVLLFPHTILLLRVNESLGINIYIRILVVLTIYLKLKVLRTMFKYGIHWSPTIFPQIFIKIPLLYCKMLESVLYKQFIEVTTCNSFGTVWKSR